MNNIYNQPDTTQTVQPQPVKVSPLIAISFREMIGAAVAGLISGLILFALLYLLNNYVFGLLLCRDESQICQAAPLISMSIATIIASLAGLGILARMRIYRPLLVVLAAAISLWSIYILLAGMAWYWGAIITAIFFALAYMLFTWIARIRSFLITIIIAVIILIIVRLSLVG